MCVAAKFGDYKQKLSFIYIDVLKCNDIPYNFVTTFSAYVYTQHIHEYMSSVPRDCIRSNTDTSSYRLIELKQALHRINALSHSSLHDNPDVPFCIYR